MWKSATVIISKVIRPKPAVNSILVYSDKANNSARRKQLQYLLLQPQPQYCHCQFRFGCTSSTLAYRTIAVVSSTTTMASRGKGRKKPQSQALQEKEKDSESCMKHDNVDNPPIPENPRQDIQEGELAANKMMLTKKSKWEPKHWQTVLENIKGMRSLNDAPVDSMGCERTMEENVDPKTWRYQSLVSLMLSSQTKDQVTFAAMQRLQKDIGLNIETILNTEESIIVQAIKPVSFHNRKAKYIKDATKILRDQYKDDIPNTVEGLCSLPGVGQKMAYICMNVAWNQNAGIGVDTHVHRIANRLGWTGPKESKTPEKTREALESWLAPELWQEINILLVGFGQTICTAVRPKCANCLNNTLCSYGKAELKKAPTKKKSRKNASSKANDDEVETNSDEGETNNLFLI